MSWNEKSQALCHHWLLVRVDMIDHSPGPRCLRGPQLPPFLAVSRRVEAGRYEATDPYSRLLNRLKGELGFQHQQTALRWLLEQLESCSNLRGVVLVLLDQADRVRGIDLFPPDSEGGHGAGSQPRWRSTAEWG